MMWVEYAQLIVLFLILWKLDSKEEKEWKMFGGEEE